MPDKGSEKIKRLTQIKPVKAHKKLQRGSERPGANPLSPANATLTKRPPRNKG
jgi:hypothetical protein